MTFVQSSQPADAALEAAIRAWLAAFPPATPALVVPIFNAFEHVLECVQSLAATVDATTPVLLIDDASTDARVQATFTDTAQFGPNFGYFRKESNSGFVGSCNLGFAAADRRDVVLVNSDTLYPPGWLERLRAAAYARANVATATPLTNHGSMVSVPQRNRPMESIPGDLPVEEADARIQAASRRLRPLIPTGIGHCTYVRRSALEIVGFFDWAFVPGYGEEVDLSLRAVTAGFVHVVADDLFIFHKGAKSFSAEGQEKRQRMKDAHEALIDTRYPWYRAWVAEESADPGSPLAQALDRAATALVGPRLAIDATFVNPTTTGTMVVSLELIRAFGALARQHAHVTVLVRSGWPDEMRRTLLEYVDDVRPVGDFHELAGPQFDLMVRFLQALTPEDLLRLRTLARRFVVMQLDLIAYANPAYQRSYAEWQRYRTMTDLTFAYADGIAFNSGDVYADAVQRGLAVPEGRTCIAYNGVDHHFHRAGAHPPKRGDEIPAGDFVLVLGTNFLHKNRAYAIRLSEALMTRHGWTGKLVFAGPSVAYGGDGAQIAAALQASPRTGARFVDVGFVDEAEKRWLLEQAALVLYPSTAEGFGLIPFEAAAAGTPTLTARVSSLPEVLGEDVRYLTFDHEEDVAAVWALLSDPERAAAQLAAIQARSARFRWDEVAARIRQLCDEVLTAPPRSNQMREQVQAVRRLLQPGALDGRADKSWRQRLQFGLHIIRTEGLRPFAQEVKQYLRWVLK